MSSVAPSTVPPRYPHLRTDKQDGTVAKRDARLDAPKARKTVLASAWVPVNITEDDHGRTVNVRKGQLVKLTLSNPATGYEWSVLESDRAFGLPAAVKNVPGKAGTADSPGATEFTWKTTSDLTTIGKHRVRLDYLRDKAVSDAGSKSFSVLVNVVK